MHWQREHDVVQTIRMAVLMRKCPCRIVISISQKRKLFHTDQFMDVYGDGFDDDASLKNGSVSTADNYQGHQPRYVNFLCQMTYKKL
jgi:hypothetical protein